MIVCEGARTEPNYFTDAVKDLRVPTANVVVFGEECGSSPESVVNFAVGQFKLDNDYDFVYCVFDRDEHVSYQAALDRCLSLRKKNSEGKVCPFIPITSDPCSEFWFLLHFIDSDSPIVRCGARTPGAEAERLLRTHYHEYRKGGRIYDVIRDSLPQAVERALRINHRSDGNPHSKIVDLIRRLFELRPQPPGDWHERMRRAFAVLP